MVEDPLEVAATGQFVADVYPPKQRFHPGVFIDDGRLHIALGVRDWEPGNVDGRRWLGKSRKGSRGKKHKYNGIPQMFR